MPYALIYNKELYEMGGISKPPTTQGEYVATAKQLTKRPNQFGHAARSTMAEQNGWFWDLTHWVLGYGGAWASGKKPLVTEPPVINAVKIYKRLYDDAVPQGATASDYRRMAWEGKVAQYIDNSANIGILNSGNPNILSKIFTAPPPWENRESMTVSCHVGIYSGSKNKEAAKTTSIFLLTGGGPASATETIVIRVYNTAFRFFDLSYGATLGVAGLVLALLVTLLYYYVQRRWSMEAL